MGLQTLDHAVAALKALGASRGGLRLVDVERLLSLTHPTAHRLMSALLDHGLVAIDAKTQLYRLGPELKVLGSAARVGPHDVSKPLAESASQLASEAGETVFVSTFSGCDGVCVERYPGKYPVEAIEVGGRSPLGLGAGSQAILASLPDQRADGMIDAVARHYPGRVEAPQIRLAVARARRAGWSVSCGLMSDTVRAIGVAVRDPQGEPLAALVVVGAANRLSDKRVNVLVEMLMRSRRRIEVRALAGAAAPRRVTPRRDSDA
jgi:DNA-binding IclR family transcriptional regulator